MEPYRYLRYEITDGKVIADPMSLILAVRGINHATYYELQPHLMRVEKEEWEAVIALLKDSRHGLSVRAVTAVIKVSEAEVKSAYETAQKMLAFQQSKEQAALSDALKTLLPISTQTLQEKLAHDFPTDVITQTIVLHNIQQNIAEKESGNIATLDTISY